VSDKTLEPGEPSEHLNGLTPEQFRAQVVQLEAAMLGMFQGNTGMMATCVVELIVRMTMDADEISREVGDQFLAGIHKQLDATMAQWRDHYAQIRAKLESDEARKKLN
jgi:hypothetical protein